MIYTKDQLAHLWIHAGGAVKVAPVMAAIAMAESRGGAEPYGDVYRGQGPTSFGLWQIHTRTADACLINTLPGTRPYDEHRLVADSLYNARAAVRIEKSQGLNAWSTYNHGHGRYLTFMPPHAHHAPRKALRHHASLHTHTVHHVRSHHPTDAKPDALWNCASSFILATLAFSLFASIRASVRVYRHDREAQRRLQRRRVNRTGRRSLAPIRTSRRTALAR